MFHDLARPSSSPKNEQAQWLKHVWIPNPQRIFEYSFCSRIKFLVLSAALVMMNLGPSRDPRENYLGSDHSMMHYLLRVVKCQEYKLRWFRLEQTFQAVGSRGGWRLIAGLFSDWFFYASGEAAWHILRMYLCIIGENIRGWAIPQ